MTRKTRVRIVRWIVAALTIVAFAGSYRHGVEWVTSHWTTGEAPGVWAWVTAALPEVMVIVAVLRYPDDSRDLRVWLTGGTAVAWTLWANGASAGPGLSGLIIAMWPAWAALMALTLMGHGPAPEVAQLVTVARKPRPVTRANGSFTPVDDPAPVTLAAVVSRETDGPADTAMARGVAWAIAQPSLPSRAEIEQEIKCSTKTASRIRTAARAVQEAGATDRVMVP